MVIDPSRRVPAPGTVAGPAKPTPSVAPAPADPVDQVAARGAAPELDAAPNRVSTHGVGGAVTAATVSGPVGQALGATRLSDLEAPLVVPVSQYDNPVKRALANDRLTEGVVLHGTDTPTIVDLTGGTHFTWVDPPLDASLGYGPDLVARTVAASRGTAGLTFVQVPDRDTALMKQYMDAGALGIAAPGIRTEAEAQQFLRTIKYPPDGLRGVGPAFSTHFLRPGNVAQAVNQANGAMLAMVLVDTPEAVANLDAIASARVGDPPQGVDILFVDEKRLGQALGASPSSPEVQAAVARIEATARQHHLALGARVDSRPDALALYGRGYRMVTVGSDTQFIQNEVDNFLAQPLDPTWEAQPRPADGPFDNPIKANLQQNKMSYGFFKMGNSRVDAAIWQDRLHFSWSDAEHSPISPADVAALAATNRGHDAVPTARIARWDVGARPGEPQIVDYLDAGAKAIICPQIESPEQARSFLNALKFKTPQTPDGTRPVTDRFRQSLSPGLSLEAAQQRANAAVMGVVMIETTTGLQHVKDIVRVPGIDVLHIGPYDLRLSLSRNADFRSGSPEQQNALFNQAVGTIESAAREAHVPLGGLAVDRADARRKYELGYRFLTVSSDQEGNNNSNVLQDFAVFPPVDRAQTRANKTHLLERFRDIPWRNMGEGRRGQVVTDDTGTHVHVIAPSGIGASLSHPAAQQTTVLAGETRVKIGGLPERTLVAGEVVNIGPGITHTFTNTSPAVEVIDDYYPARPDLEHP